VNVRKLKIDADYKMPFPLCRMGNLIKHGLTGGEGIVTYFLMFYLK